MVNQLNNQSNNRSNNRSNSQGNNKILLQLGNDINIIIVTIKQYLIISKRKLDVYVGISLLVQFEYCLCEYVCFSAVYYQS